MTKPNLCLSVFIRGFLVFCRNGSLNTAFHYFYFLPNFVAFVFFVVSSPSWFEVREKNLCVLHALRGSVAPWFFHFHLESITPLQHKTGQGTQLFRSLSKIFHRGGCLFDQLGRLLAAGVLP